MSGEDMIGVGIDLGTANSVVARMHMEGARPAFTYAKDLFGAVEIPSSIYIDQHQSFYHGVAAVRAAQNEHASGRVLNNVKLLLRDDVPIPVGDRKYLPSELVREFLVYLKKCYGGLVGDGR